MAYEIFFFLEFETLKVFNLKILSQFRDFVSRKYDPRKYNIHEIILIFLRTKILNQILYIYIYM